MDTAYATPAVTDRIDDIQCFPVAQVAIRDGLAKTSATVLCQRPEPKRRRAKSYAPLSSVTKRPSSFSAK